MKSLKEALIKRDRTYKYIERNVQPKTKEELKDIIKETIKKEGPDCDLYFIDTSFIDDMGALFYNSPFNGDISRWNVSNVKDMHGMFMKSNFDGDISGWDTSNVNNMHAMFCDSKFNRDISNWDVRNVEDMGWMFHGSKFNGDIYGWDVMKVKVKYGIFENCPLKDQPDKQPKFS